MSADVVIGASTSMSTSAATTGGGGWWRLTATTRRPRRERRCVIVDVVVVVVAEESGEEEEEEEEGVAVFVPPTRDGVVGLMVAGPLRPLRLRPLSPAPRYQPPAPLRGVSRGSPGSLVPTVRRFPTARPGFHPYNNVHDVPTATVG